jgi:hypothetical protein
MSSRRVAQVLVFFQCEVLGIWHKLAYVWWFETKGKDTVTGLFPLRRTTKRSVIQVDDIERGVHLIPRFGRQVGDTVWKKRLVEQSQRTLILPRSRSPETSGSDSNSEGRENPLGGGMDSTSSGANGAGSESHGASLKVKHWIDVWPHYDEYWLNTWSDNAIYKLIY